MSLAEKRAALRERKAQTRENKANGIKPVAAEPKVVLKRFLVKSRLTKDVAWELESDFGMQGDAVWDAIERAEKSPEKSWIVIDTNWGAVKRKRLGVVMTLDRYSKGDADKTTVTQPAPIAPETGAVNLSE